jgi:hypothetical protein
MTDKKSEAVGSGESLLASVIANASRCCTRRRGRIGTFAIRVRAFWREIEPGLQIQHDDSAIARWDAEGEGPGWSIDFEGFGISACLFIGRTPRRRAEDE